MAKFELADVYVQVLRETPKAYLVSDGVHEVWVPKSQVAYDPDPKEINSGTMTMPVWLAEKTELV